MNAHIGLRNNPSPPDTTRRDDYISDEAGRLERDSDFISRTLTDAALLSYSNAWRHTTSDGTTRVYPAVTTGESTLRALMHGTPAEVLAAVDALRAYVTQQAEELAAERWDDAECGL